MKDDRLLRIYLNDHLAGAIAGRELAKRCRSSNRANDLGRYLATLLDELRADETELRRIIARVGGHEDRVKQAFGWLAEKAGRLKLNGRIVSYSDLSRLEEVEGLCIAVDAKRSLWRLLRDVASRDPRLAEVDLPTLEERAARQRTAPEEHRVRAAARAFRP